MTLESARDELFKALGAPEIAPLEHVTRLLTESFPRESMTLYAQAELLRRQGDIARAFHASATLLAAVLGEAAMTAGQLDLLKVFQVTAAVTPEQGARLAPYVQQFGHLLCVRTAQHPLDAALDSLAAPIAAQARAARLEPLQAILMLRLLGFTAPCPAPWAKRMFDTVVVPWMLAAARGANFETALMLESIAYDEYVKRVESQAWFKETTSRWIPALAAASRAHAPPAAERHAAWRAEPVRRVGFFVHNATMLAHIVVLIETLEAVREIGARNYQFTVFVGAGRNVEMEQALARCGVAVRYLLQPPARGHFNQIMALERMLREGNFAACFWISLVTMMAVAFARRIAPVQGWWAMKYHACDIAEIDAHLGMENAVTRKRMEGIDWRVLGTASTRWFDAAKSEGARRLRATFPGDAIVAASIGRSEKLDSPDFLAVVSRLLKSNPRLVFLWTGKTQRPSIQQHFEREGVADRARFVGWVDTRLYAQAIDLFLDSFPFPCGFTLKEAMAAGKPAVMYRCPESLETGVPGAISPVVEGSSAVALEVREAMRHIFTRERAFDLYFCAASPEEYFEMAQRLIEDQALARAAGAANRRYIETFLSSPRDEAKKFLDHMDEIFAAIPAQPRPNASSPR